MSESPNPEERPKARGPAPGESAPGGARGEIDPGAIDLAARPRARLEAMRAAGDEVLACDRVLRRTDGNVVAELLKGHGAFYEWTHYPTGDVYDAESHAQYYYHAHPGVLREHEHGHFHLFLRAPGMPEGARPIAYDGAAIWPSGAERLSHIVAVSMDSNATPLRLFTANRWVTGDCWYPARDVRRMVERFAIDHAEPSWPTNRWIGAMTRLFAPDIALLLVERDRSVETWRRAHPERDVFEDRELEITSHIRISVEERIEALRALLG